MTNDMGSDVPTDSVMQDQWCCSQPPVALSYLLRPEQYALCALSFPFSRFAAQKYQKRVAIRNFGVAEIEVMPKDVGNIWRASGRQHNGSSQIRWILEPSLEPPIAINTLGAGIVCVASQALSLNT